VEGKQPEASKSEESISPQSRRRKKLFSSGKCDDDGDDGVEKWANAIIKYHQQTEDIRTQYVTCHLIEFCALSPYAGDTHSSRLVQENCTCVSQSSTSFLHASSIPAQKLSGTWHEPCNVIGLRVVLVQETVMNLREIFRACFWNQFLVQVSWACFTSIRVVR